MIRDNDWLDAYRQGWWMGAATVVIVEILIGLILFIVTLPSWGNEIEAKAQPGSPNTGGICIVDCRQFNDDGSLKEPTWIPDPNFPHRQVMEGWYGCRKTDGETDVSMPIRFEDALCVRAVSVDNAGQWSTGSAKRYVCHAEDAL